MFGPATSRGKRGSIPIQFSPLTQRTFWPTQGIWRASPLVGLKGTVGSSHVFGLLLVPRPHFPEDAGDATGSASRQW